MYLGSKFIFYGKNWNFKRFMNLQQNVTLLFAIFLFLIYICIVKINWTPNRKFLLRPLTTVLDLFVTLELTRDTF